MKITAEIHPLGFLEHFMSEDIYIRVITIPANTFMVGHKHLTKHMNILLEGSMSMKISDEQEVRVMEAPYIFESNSATQKALITKTVCKFANIMSTKDIDVNMNDNVLTNVQKIKNHSIEEVAIPIEFTNKHIKLLGGDN